MNLPRGVRDMTGLKIHRLKIISFAGMRDPSKKPPGGMWLCECDCGKQVTVLGAAIRSGNTKSCGCQKIESTIRRNTTHGMAARGKENRSPIYTIWCGMKSRCTRENYHSYHRYGGRGIKVCERWNDFAAFEADMIETWKPGLEIDRKDNDGDYCKDNCRWATRQEQSGNRSSNRFFTFNGETKTIAEWGRRYGSHVVHRLYAGWPFEEAISSPRFAKRNK